MSDLENHCTNYNISVSKSQLFLSSALYDGLEDSSISHLRTILEKTDASPNVILPNQGISPFHLAIGNESESFAEEVTRLFIQHGGNPNVRSVDGETPVHVAAAWGRASLLELLLLNGGDPWLHDVDGKNAFHYAYEGNHWKVINALQSFRPVYLLEKDESNEEKYILTFEKLFLHKENVAFEYGPKDKSSVRMHCIRSAATQTREPVSSDSGKNAVKGFQSPEKRNQTYMTQEPILKEKTYNNNNFIHSYSSFSNNQSNSNPVHCSTELSKVNVIQKSTRKEKGMNLDSKVENLSTKCSYNNSMKVSPTMKDMNLKEKLLEELRSVQTSDKFKQHYSSFEDKSIIEDVHNLDEDQSSSLFGTGKDIDVPREKEQNLKSKEELNLQKENSGSFQAGIHTASDCRVNGKRRKSYIGEYLTKKVSAEVNNHNVKNDVITTDAVSKNNMDRNYSISDLDSEVDYTMENIIKELGNASLDRNRILDEFSPYEGTRDGEWIASRSCFLVTSSPDYITCGEESLLSTAPEYLPKIVQSTSDESAKCIQQLQCRTNTDRPASVTSSSSSESFMSLAEEYKYTDEEEGVVLLERRLLVPTISISGLQSEMAGNKMKNPSISFSMFSDEHNTGQSSESDTSVPSSLDYDTDILRGKLKESGYIPGPITPTTKRLYLRKLVRLQKKPVKVSAVAKVYSPELQRTLQDFSWQSNVINYLTLEKEVAQQFSQPDPLRRWPEGSAKSSFTYLLLDPRITNNLPCRTSSMSPMQVWTAFLTSIFYVGKGKRSRPYSHLYQALASWNRKFLSSGDKKVCYIQNIWKAGLGVVCLHVFQNVIPVEAYTREAAMIDAIKVQNLKNERCGKYYGVATTWTSHQKRMLGVYLLYRAMCIFLHEGERQLRPEDIG